MTPAEHLARAENLAAQLDQADTYDQRSEGAFLVAWALVHVAIAIAAELGVPHGGTTGGESGGQASSAGS